MIRGIYAIRNSVNGKQYIGSSKDCDKRFSIHCRLLRHGKHDNRHLQAAWERYGSAAFSLVILCVVDPGDNLLAKEQELLPSGNYNIAPMAGRPPGIGRPYTLEERQHFSEIRKGKPVPWLRGTGHTPEASAKRIASMTGQKRTLEQRARISAGTKGSGSPKRSAALIGNTRGKGPRSEEFKRKISEALNRPEVQAKLSAANKGRKQSAECVAARVARQLGKKRTPEQKARMSAAHIGRAVAAR